VTHRRPATYSDVICGTARHAADDGAVSYSVESTIFGHVLFAGYVCAACDTRWKRSLIDAMPAKDLEERFYAVEAPDTRTYRLVEKTAGKVCYSALEPTTAGSQVVP